MNNPQQPLRIGIFMDDFYPYSGGVARSIELQVNELVKLGHHVTLFAPKPFFEAPLNCPSEDLDVWHIPGTPSFLCSVKFGRKLAERIARRYKFDIVHSQNERGSMFLAARIAHLLSIPHVHTFHSNYAGTHRTSPVLSAINSYTYMKLAPRIMRRMRPDLPTARIRIPEQLVASERSRIARADWKSISQLAFYCDAFTSPAPFVINSINYATHGTLAGRSHVVPNGINPVYMRATRIREHEPIVRFLSCCRLDPEKRVDVIIEAFHRLDREDTELYIVGDGSEMDSLKRLVRKLQPRGKVKFLGQYDDPEQIADAYANSDVFVMGSYRFDTQGMVLAEAAASGTAILYCDDRLTVGVTPDNALLVNPGATAFSDGMRVLANDPARRQRMATASKQLGPTLTSTVMAERFVACYHQARAIVSTARS